jgi:hypothetical protein
MNLTFYITKSLFLVHSTLYEGFGYEKKQSNIFTKFRDRNCRFDVLLYVTWVIKKFNCKKSNGCSCSQKYKNIEFAFKNLELVD